MIIGIFQAPEIGKVGSHHTVTTMVESEGAWEIN
jgi:hypothetical protein